MRALRLLSLCGFAVLTVAAAASAQEAVRTRAATHPDYGRIVFDWPYRVGFEANVVDQALTVRFDAPLTTDLDRAVGLVAQYVRSGVLSPDGLEVRFDLTGAYGLTAFRNGNSVVLDIARQAEAPAQAVRVRVGEHSAFTRFVFDWEQTVPFEAEAVDGRITVRFAAKARFDIGAIARRLPEHLSGVAAELDGETTVFRVDSSRRHRLRTFRSGTKVVVDVVDMGGADGEAAETTPAQAAPPPENAPRRLITPQAPAQAKPADAQPPAKPAAAEAAPAPAARPQQPAPTKTAETRPAVPAIADKPDRTAAPASEPSPRPDQIAETAPRRRPSRPRLRRRRPTPPQRRSRPNRRPPRGRT